MNNKFISVLIGTIILLFVVSSCGGARGLSFNKKNCARDLQNILQGKLSKIEHLCAPINFNVEETSNYIIVRGKQTQGHFDVKLGKSKNNLFIQAPHIWSDEGTGALLEKLKKKINPRISFKNSVHRNNKTQLKKHSGVNFDLGKRKESILFLLSKEFINEYPKGSIIQLHGFASEKRKTIKGKNADIIISSGSYMQSKRVKKLSKCLKNKSGGLQVFSFPSEVTELGGTKNILSSLSKLNGKSLFVHFEMSKRYRELVLKNEKLFEQLALCIQDLSYVE